MSLLPTHEDEFNELKQRAEGDSIWIKGLEDENKHLKSLIDELKEDIFNEDIGGAIKTLRHHGITK